MLARVPDGDLLAIEGDETLVMRDGDGGHLLRRRVPDRAALQARPDLSDEPGSSDGAAPHHHGGGARLREATPGIIERADIAIGNDRDRHGIDDG